MANCVRISVFQNNRGLLLISLINDDIWVIIGNVCFLGGKHCAWCSTCWQCPLILTQLYRAQVSTDISCLQIIEKTEAQG